VSRGPERYVCSHRPQRGAQAPSACRRSSNPDGGPPELTVNSTQTLPGVGQWDDGHQYINTAIERPAAPANSHLPWVIVGLGAVLALLGGIAAWVWKHPRGDHAVSNAPAEPPDAYASTEWLNYRDDDADAHSDGPGAVTAAKGLGKHPLSS